MASNLRHELASQRRTFRVTAPIDVMLDGERYQTLNWSVLDFKLGGYRGVHRRGDEIILRLTVPYQGFDVAFDVTAKVANADTEAGTLAGEFLHLGEREKEILETFVAGLVRGEMESIRGVIRRMDLPVTPVSLKPDKLPTPEELVREVRRRTLGSMLYIAAGIVFTLALGVVMYTNLFQVKVQTAVLTAPTDALIAPATGTLQQWHAAESGAAKEGDALVTFNDPELEQDIARAALKLEELKLQTGDKDNAKQAGSQTTELTAVRATVNAMQQTLKSQQAVLAQLRGLLAQGLTRRADVDSAQAKMFDTQSKLNQALERLTELEQKSNVKTSLLSVAQGEYDLLLARRDRLKLAANAPGHLTRLLAPEGAAVRYGDAVGLFEHQGPKYVEAYLTREEALAVAKDDRATVYFPSQHKRETLRVAAVDYASPLLARQEGRSNAAPTARDVTVRLAIETPQAEEAVKAIVPGTQVIVVFSRSLWGR